MSEETVNEESSTMGQARRSGLPLVSALCVACVVLLASAIWLGTNTAPLWSERSPAGVASTPEPTPTETATPVTLAGHEVRVQSELEVRSFAVDVPSEYHTLVYALITNDSDSEAAHVYYDFTAYAEDGTVIERSPAIAYLLPGQTSVLNTIMREDISGAEWFALEQTTLERSAPFATGDIAVDTIGSPDGDYWIEGTATSSLDQVGDYPDQYVIAFLDGEIIGVCEPYSDIPAGGSFEFDCPLEPAANDSPKDIEELPADAELKYFYLLSPPY